METCPTRREAWVVAALCFSSISAASCDCRRKEQDPSSTGDAAADADVTARAEADADAKPPTEASPFVVVAEGGFSLRRARGGPAYAVAGRFPFTLDPTGALTPMRSLITEPMLNGIGAIGAAPEGVTYVEGVIFGSGTDDSITIGLAGSASYHVVNGERFVGFFPWTDGAILTIRSEGAAHAISVHKGRFAALGGPKSKRVPTIPAATRHADEFAAYPDGRVLLVAADGLYRGWDGQEDRAFVLDFAGSGVEKPKRMALPGGNDVYNTYLDAGRSLAELVIYQRRFAKFSSENPKLMILEGESFIEVPLGLDLPVASLSRGDDGSLWLTTGYWDGSVPGSLYRVTIAGRHAELVKIPVPANPQQVVAISATDVWLTASESGHPEKSKLLHTQAAVGPRGVFVHDNDFSERDAWSEVAPPPSRSGLPGCPPTTLILGNANDLNEVRVLDVIKKLGDFAASLLRGRLGGETVWAIESWESGETRSGVETKFKTNAALLRELKKFLPSAHFVCALVRVDRTVPLH